MAGRSLIATPNGIQQINRALTERGWSREDLAKKCDCSRQPAVKFCSGQAVSRKLFVSFCKVLGLDWEDIAGQKSAPVPAETIDATDIGALVQTVRAQVHADIQDRCGKMRVLDMEQPIGIGDIYTSVNILKKLSGSRRLSLDELLQDCDMENFDRFLLGQVRHERVPGLEAVERHNQLMILGKPGAGKTTFMKRLAILCNQGEFQPQRVPIFVTLKDYAEAEGKPKLQTYIQRQWNACGVAAADALSTILGNGHALVLLDGLDEVSEADHDRVLQDIKTFVHEIRICQCMITCRIAAWEYIFEQFTEVEVADLDQDQIAEFATKWFKAKNDSQKAETFIQRLNDNQPIQELATNPLLLTLLCLMFGEAADFPTNRAELYKEGLDILLKKWDGKRNIERDQVYKKLSFKRKEDFLSQLAFETFEQGNYFFKQAIVEQHIIRYIRNLPGASDDDEALQLDGEAVLKSIEAQHGLLVERARGIYSFSHLTFQEYFAAKKIIDSAGKSQRLLRDLSTCISKKRYRVIISLVLDMLPIADIFLLSIKQCIDQIMVDESNTETKLKLTLDWIKRKSIVFNTSFKMTSVRAFYLTLAFSHDLIRISTLSLHNILGLDNTFLDTSDIMNIDRRLIYVLDIVYSLELDFTLELDNDSDTSLTFNLAQDLSDALDEVLLIQNNSQFSFEIQLLRNDLINQNDYENLKKWWELSGEHWIKKLRKLMVDCYDTGYDWQFSRREKDRLWQYYDANKFLINCLNSDCYVTKATRQYIEDTLLLPLSEIEKYPVPDAIANL